MTKRAEDFDDPMNGLVTTAEAAALIRHSKATLDKWRGLEKGPKWVKIGSKIFYDVHELNRWVSDQRRRAIGTR